MRYNDYNNSITHVIAGVQHARAGRRAALAAMPEEDRLAWLSNATAVLEKGDRSQVLRDEMNHIIELLEAGDMPVEQAKAQLDVLRGQLTAIWAPDHCDEEMGCDVISCNYTGVAVDCGNGAFRCPDHS
jgi:hypothetical protein